MCYESYFLFSPRQFNDIISFLDFILVESVFIHTITFFSFLIPWSECNFIYFDFGGSPIVSGYTKNKSSSNLIHVQTSKAKNQQKKRKNPWHSRVNKSHWRRFPDSNRIGILLFLKVKKKGDSGPQEMDRKTRQKNKRLWASKQKLFIYFCIFCFLFLVTMFEEEENMDRHPSWSTTAKVPHVN